MAVNPGIPPEMLDGDNPPKLQKWEQNLNLQVHCPECKEDPPNLVEEFSSGDMVCGSCGLVLGDRIVDTRSEWRTFSNDDQGNDDPSRVGEAANPLLNGSQLQTTISFGDGGSGRSRELHRAQNKSTHDKSTKQLLQAYKEIQAYCDGWSLDKHTIDCAKQLFKLVDDAKAFKGKSQEVLIAGCIFIACRQCRVPRTFQEVFALTKVPRKEIGRIFKQLERFFYNQNKKRRDELEEQGKLLQARGTQKYEITLSTEAKDLIDRYCNDARLSKSMVACTRYLAEQMTQSGILAGRSPVSAAAACIYMASHLFGDPKTAKDISKSTGVSDGTIRTAYKHLYADRFKLLDSKWVEEHGGKFENLPTNA